MASLIDHKPEITQPERRVSGDIGIDIKTQKDIDSVSNPEEDRYIKYMDKLLASDTKVDAVLARNKEAGAPLSIKIDTSVFPLLSDAISRLTDGASNNTITYPLYEKSLAIMDNAFVVQNGFEGSQILFSKKGEAGRIIPKVEIPDTMSCDEVANFDLDMHQSEEEMPMQAAYEQRQRATQFSMIASLFYMLLGFTLRKLAKMLKKTKLQKVPIAGRVVKKQIKNLNRAADKLLNKLRNGTSFDMDGEDAKDLRDYVSDVDHIASNSSSECIGAAHKVLKHAFTWALNTSTAEHPEALAVITRPIINREHDAHERTKLFVLSTLPESLNESDKARTLNNNTRKYTAMSNRYFNKSVAQRRKA